MAFESIRKFFRRLKGMFTNGIMQSIAEIADSENIASSNMMTAIDTWIEMYYGNAPWLKESSQSLGIPAIVASEIARAVTLEMEVNITGSPMAEYISDQFEPVRKNIRQNVEYACAGGGLVFKPYIYDGNITTEVIQANAFYPVAYDNSHKITAAYFIYRSWRGKYIFSRLEKHELNGTDYTITNRAFVSTKEDTLGDECMLSEVPEWEDIEPIVTLQNVSSTLFSYFRIPIGNTIDISSPLGVSVYSRAVGLIEEADLQFQRLIWEYEGGELAIDASEDAFRHIGGEPVLPKGKERLYRANNLDAATTGGEGLFKEWAPALRDSNYMSGLNKLLSRIEDSCSISRGTLSDPYEIAKTATEIKIMKQRSYATITDIQKSLESSLDDLAYAMYCLAVLYDLCPDGAYETTYVWDDSIIVDAEAERIRDQQEVAQGLMLAYEYRMKWYGEDEETARRKLGELAEMSDEEILGFGTEPSEDEGSGQSSQGQQDAKPREMEIEIAE